MKVYVLHFPLTLDQEQLWQEVEHLEPLYSEEDEKAGHLFCRHLPHILPDGVIDVTCEELPEIDWEAQWRECGADYRDGYVHFAYGKLVPGAGFGDSAHPTTQLMLQLMEDRVSGREVVDMGCGSGILSIAAVQLGAQKVCAVDIDPLACQHTLANVALNQCSDRVIVDIPKSLSKETLLLSNMTLGEQQCAFESLGHLHQQITTVIVSGLLKEQYEEGVRFLAEYGYRVVQCEEKDQWIGVVCQRSS